MPPELGALLSAGKGTAREQRWSAFLEVHSRLLLHVARSLGGDHDAAMDRYAYVLDRLAEDDHRRLRAYTPDGRTKFTTWLVVVVRRLCLDHHRARYGRAQGDGNPGAARRIRRTLADHLVEQVDASRVANPAPSPEHEARTRDLHARLREALAGLEPRDRVLLALRFEDDRSAREIAEFMDFPTPFHVYRAINRLLAELRQHLGASGVDGPLP